MRLADHFWDPRDHFSDSGAAWRIGIDTEHRTIGPNGTFRHLPQSHIPGKILTLLGLLLTLPNALTLLAFVLGVVLIGVQVRVEEEHLAQLHPEAYGEYRQRVRRWL